MYSLSVSIVGVHSTGLYQIEHHFNIQSMREREREREKYHLLTVSRLSLGFYSYCKVDMAKCYCSCKEINGVYRSLDICIMRTKSMGTTRLSFNFGYSTVRKGPFWIEFEDQFSLLRPCNRKGMEG